MADPVSSDSPQAKLILECSRGFRAEDLAITAKTLHKDFRNVPYPRSLGHPAQTKEEWLENWAGIMSLRSADIDVSRIGYSSDPSAATKFLPQPTFHFIIDIPGKVVAYVRI
jgi:hypothetical protein